MSEQKFELRFPFRPLHWVSGLETPRTWSVGGVDVSLSAEEPLLVLRAGLFESESAAAAYLPRLWAALAWASVKRGTGFQAEMEIHRVTFADDPVAAGKNLWSMFGIPDAGPVDGLIDGNFPAVVPAGKVIRCMTVGGVTATNTLPVDLVQPLLSEALGRPEVAELYADDRLRLAVELFCDAQRELSLRSKLLTFVTGLEVLAEPISRHQVALEVLEAFDRTIEVAQQKWPNNSEEFAALEALTREVKFRREDSLRSRVRRLVLDGLPALSQSERAKRATDVVRAYDTRSRLVHEGVVSARELHDAHETARLALADLLEARFRRASGEQQSPATAGGE